MPVFASDKTASSYDLSSLGFEFGWVSQRHCFVLSVRYTLIIAYSMCDFSHYGGRSDEWLELEKSLPPMRPPGYGQEAIDARDARNKFRQELSVFEMQAFAGKLDIRNHKIIARDGCALEARSYRPVAVGKHRESAAPVYMHLHGGGFLFGTIASEDALCARIACNLGIIVLNLNYRHTPEFTYPT